VPFHYQPISHEWVDILLNAAGCACSLMENILIGCTYIFINVEGHYISRPKFVLDFRLLYLPRYIETRAYGL
jgi:hypothetical protein